MAARLINISDGLVDQLFQPVLNHVEMVEKALSCLVIVAQIRPIPSSCVPLGNINLIKPHRLWLKRVNHIEHDLRIYGSVTPTAVNCMACNRHALINIRKRTFVV